MHGPDSGAGVAEAYVPLPVGTHGAEPVRCAQRERCLTDAGRADEADERDSRTVAWGERGDDLLQQSLPADEAGCLGNRLALHHPRCVGIDWLDPGVQRITDNVLAREQGLDRIRWVAARVAGVVNATSTGSRAGSGFPFGVSGIEGTSVRVVGVM
nr:hypothetical protein [Streptomyces sp. GC420]